MVDYLVFFVLLAVPIALCWRYLPLPVYVDDPYKNCESPIERRLYLALLQNGYQIETQTPCGPYRIDITIPGARIAIEADGKAYHSSPTQKAHDKRKNEYLKKNGWTVLRFSGRQINKEMPKVLRKIEDVTR
ncbi:DUF559 domain-containing protein [Bacillus sp. CFBP 13597]|nr:DUF559 domain-containing protein [Bacillus sp. CFBP 13597]